MADIIENIAEALTTNEVAKILKVKLSRVQELVRQGVLPHFRLGRQIRIDRQQLQQFIARGGQALPGGWRRTTGAADVGGDMGSPEVSR
jgi:excisionase family DNA binding protein